MTMVRMVWVLVFVLGAFGAFAQGAGQVSGGGVTLTSVSADLPFGERVYPGGDAAAAINANCLSCHSTGMVLTQPKLSEATWKAEVAKMRAVYKAPVDDADAAAIVAYLVKMPVAR